MPKAPSRARILVAPALELCLAVAAVLDPAAPEPRQDWAARWLAQARRRLEPGFRRRLAELGAPADWRRLARLVEPGEGDTEAVIARLAAHPAVSAAQVEALRRFDRLAFAAFWRQAEAEFARAAQGLDRAAGDAAAVLLPTVFAPAADTVEIAGLRLVRVPSGRAPAAPVPEAAALLGPADRDPALVFRALGDATRYAIAALIGRAPMTGAELARRLGVSTPTLTHHLRLLRAAGLVIEQPAGNSIRLTLDRAAIAALSGAALARLCGDAPPPPLLRSRRSALGRAISAASAPARRR